MLLNSIVRQQSVKAQGIIVESGPDVVLAVVTQHVQGEMADQGEDAGIAADAAGILLQSGVQDMVETVLDPPVVTDDVAEVSRGGGRRTEVVGGFFPAGIPVLAGGVEALGAASDFDGDLEVVMPGLASGARGEPPQSYGALFEAGALTQLAAVVMTVRPALGTVGTDRLRERGD